MREIRKSGSMRGCRKRAFARRACVLLYKAPEKPSTQASAVRSGCRLVRMYQLLIDLINRMAESLGRAVIFRLNFIGKWCHRTAFVPDLPRRSAAQRPVRAMLVVVILPTPQLIREIRCLQIDRRVELFDVSAL